MSRYKMFAFITLVTLAFGIAIVGNALAGEKFKCRGVKYCTKWEQINVGDEKGHVIVLYEAVGIHSNMEGNPFGEGMLNWEAGVLNISPSTGMTGNGYLTLTDRDGDKIYMNWDVKPAGPNEWAFYKGTGKFEGIQGKGTHSTVNTADPKQWYIDWEGEVELPR
jgi:hypothetical protein